MKTCIIKKNIINFFTSTFFLFLIIWSISTKCEALENKILFKVNNEIITSIDLLNNLNYLKSLNKQIKKRSPDFIVEKIFFKNASPLVGVKFPKLEPRKIIRFFFSS